MGFAKGFAQGWENESERIERRKLFQQEMNEKRLATLAEVISRRKSAGLSGGSGGEATGSIDADHYSNVLLNYGMTPDSIAELASKGGGYGLKAAAEVIEKNPNAVWTPESLSKLPQAIVVTQPKNGGAVDVEAVANELYGPDFLAAVAPEQRALLDLEAAQPAQAPLVTSTFRPTEPVNIGQVVNQTVAAANETLVAELTARREQFDAMAQSPEASDEEKAAAIEQSAKFQGLIDQVGEGNVMPGIEAVGADIIGPYLENNPQLKSNPQLLGPWKFAAEEYLKGPVEEAPKETPAGTSFATKEEALNAIRSGQVPPGATFYINGQPYVNDLE